MPEQQIKGMSSSYLLSRLIDGWLVFSGTGRGRGRFLQTSQTVLQNGRRVKFITAWLPLVWTLRKCKYPSKRYEPSQQSEKISPSTEQVYVEIARSSYLSPGFVVVQVDQGVDVPVLPGLGHPDCVRSVDEGAREPDAVLYVVRTAAPLPAVRMRQSLQQETAKPKNRDFKKWKFSFSVKKKSRSFGKTLVTL